MKACQNCGINGGFSSIFTVQALSTVIVWEIVSVFPAMNGMFDSCVRILNTVVPPRVQSKHRCRDRVYVLWTRMCRTFPQPRGKTWLPNHFVPLIGKDQITSEVKTSSPVSMDSPSPDFVTIEDNTSELEIRVRNNPSPVCRIYLV